MPARPEHKDTRVIVEGVAGQSVMIGDEIEIILLEVNAGQAHLAVHAPAGVHVVPSEESPGRKR